jgi:hypothetical protein
MEMLTGNAICDTIIITVGLVILAIVVLHPHLLNKE